jgi:carboxymethylenebutenolidase
MNETLAVETLDGVFQCHVARPPGPGPHPVLIVLQEIFGVNAGIRGIAAGSAAMGYSAVCPELFWRDAPGWDLSVARDADWARGFALYTAYDFDRGVRDIGATIAASRMLPGASGKVGVTGYCMGGLLTFLSAARTDADACAAYYGGGTERFVDEARHIHAPLLYHLAGADEYIGPEAQAAIEAALAPLPNAALYRYEGRNHAFARPAGKHYDAADATLANSRTDLFWRLHLA